MSMTYPTPASKRLAVTAAKCNSLDTQPAAGIDGKTHEKGRIHEDLFRDNQPIEARW